MKAGARFAWLVLLEPEQTTFLEAMRAQVSPEHFARVQAMTEAFPELLTLLDQSGMSLARLRRVAFGAPTEKTATVCPSGEPSPETQAQPKRKRRGHGRHGARCYTGAKRVPVSHPTLKPGDLCPGCGKGKLRRQPKPAPAIRVEAQPPITATVFEMEVLRCCLCGKTFTAPTPPQAGTQKYDPSVGVMVSLLRYGSGMPFYRLEQWQRSLGVPLAASTQWELADALGRVVQPVWDHLVWVAAQAPSLFNDDTTMRVGDLRRQIRAETKPQRTGIFTTGIIASPQDHPIALFFTGRQHAGENLDQVLRQRVVDLPPPLQMCDGLSRNEPQEFETILGCCLAHGRRPFVEAISDFPQECRHVLESLRSVYRLEAQTKAQALNPEERLQFHQTHSQPVMDQLNTWLQNQIEEKRIEPNSGFGQAIGFMLRHWEPLTLFLRRAGAPLDNNVCERALKMAIMHRKNSLSYKTERGAHVGDLFMGLIHTCRLNRANPFDYFMALVRQAKEVCAHPERWLPWNYSETQAAIAPVVDTG
jgi:transposase